MVYLARVAGVRLSALPLAGDQLRAAEVQLREHSGEDWKQNVRRLLATFTVPFAQLHKLWPTAADTVLGVRKRPSPFQHPHGYSAAC